MREYVVNRPDEALLRRGLDASSGPEETILRLAWQQGLTRDEIVALLWEQVDFEDERLVLPERTVPLCAEVKQYLWRLWEGRETESAYVVASDRFGDRMQPESVSRLARKALDRAGLKSVRLMDLRHDWIIRQLQDKDWPAVARISGVEVPALQARFARFAEERPAAPRKKSAAAVDEFKLWKVLQTEKTSPAGIALWLTWQMGLQAQEIVALVWEQVDFERGVICTGDREIPMTTTVRRLLQEVLGSRTESMDPHVVLTEQSKKPVDLPRLSRLTRAALIRGGMEEVRLVDLKRDESREDADSALLALAEEKGAISRGDAMECLGATPAATYTRLRRLVEQERLVRVGGKYYLPGTVVPPEEQSAAILDYLAQWGAAYRQDIAALLRVQPKQCTIILKRMVERGEILQQGQKYLAAEPSAKAE